MVEQAKQQGQELLARGETMVADMLRGYLGQFQEYIGGSTAQQPPVIAAAAAPMRRRSCCLVGMHVLRTLSVCR